MSSDPITPRTHGGLDAEELHALGVDGAQVIDFSVNVNPYGPAPQLREALRNAGVDRYPDPTSREARRALADFWGKSPDEIVVGNGAADLLWTLARLLVRPGETALVIEPTFAEFRAAVLAGGGQVFTWRAREEDGFAFDATAVVAQAKAVAARAVYLCNPNNPTGTALPADEIATLAARLPSRCTLVLDEAFLSLSERRPDARTPLPTTVVRVRSLTKEHAVPGARAGFLMAPAPLAAGLEVTRPAWSAGALAQATALASCRLGSFVAASCTRLLDDRRALETDLIAAGLQPRPSTTTFLLVPVADAAGLRRRLLIRHQVLVRDCATFGLPGYVRIGARPAGDRARLIGALRAELPSPGP